MNHPRRQGSMDVTILLGSSSDLPIAQKCTKILEQFDVPYQLRVASAHRSPKFVEEIVGDALDDGCQIFVAMAGLAAFAVELAEFGNRDTLRAVEKPAPPAPGPYMIFGNYY